MDGLKEGKIGLNEFGLEIPKALDEVLQKTNISAEQMKTWGAAVAEGGEGGSQALVEVAKALAEVEDATVRNELGVQLFGTMWENNGSKIVDTLLNAENGTANLGENISQLADDTARLESDPAIKLQEALNNMMTALQPLLIKVAELVTKFADWAAENPGLLAAITAISAVLGILMGIFAALAPVINLIITHFGLIRTVFMALTGPVGIVIAAITALIAIGVALYKNWDEEKDFASETWSAIETAISTAIETAKTVVSATVQAISTTVSSFFQAIATTAQVIWGSIRAAIATAVLAIYNSVANTFRNVLSVATSIFNSVRNAISTVWNTLKSIVQNAASSILNSVRNAFNNLLSAVKNAMNNVRSAVSNIWNSVMSFFRGINLFSIGSNIISGLINGIKSMATSVVNSVKGVVNGAIEGAKNLLKIKSPSRVFMEIGEFTTEGFIKGIESTANQIKGTMDNVYGSLGNSAELMVNSGSGAVSNTTQITNSTPINFVLNYSGNANEFEALKMVDIIETELGNRLSTNQFLRGAK